jgi:hypothetical protein
MSSGARVTSFRPLETLDVALARFTAETEEALAGIEPEIQGKLRVLDGRREQCEQELQYWRDEYEVADPEEDDLSYISYRIEQAADNLRNLLQWQARAEESHQRYLHTARRFQAAVLSQGPRAQGFVRQKLLELRDYVGLKVNGPSGGIVVGNSSNPFKMAGAAPAPNGSRNSAIALSEMPLPQGMEWISLKSIDPAGLAELDDLQYRKDDRTPADFVAAMKLLRERILPEIKLNGEQADSDYFWKLDQQNGQQSPLNSLQEIYRICFGSEPIWVDRFVGQRYFTIGGGRHRIKAAFDLGWDAVPAKVMQASLRKGGGS